VAALGAVEIGGTKTLVASGESIEDLEGFDTIPTTDPVGTVEAVVERLRGAEVMSVGVASFGPLELRPSHDRFGYITNTPKAGWSHTPVMQMLVERLGVSVAFDTDVNGAALGEGEWGAAEGLGIFAYLTVGTGIGGGVVVDGSPIHGAPHPEVGHVVVGRHPDDDHTGSCPYHGDCLEGMAAGPSIEARFGKRGEALVGRELEDALRLVSHYIGQGLRNLVYAVAPERVIIGGGVSKLEGFHEAVGRSLLETLAGYPGEGTHSDPGFVVAPGLGDLSGLAGALLLAMRQSN
jgi:fructokinase